MTAEQVFKLYRGYKFLYDAAGRRIDFERYSNIPTPKLIDQRDRKFYYRIAQQLKDDVIHALFTVGFFFQPRAHVSALATPESFSRALQFAGRAENGETLVRNDCYELRKRLATANDIDTWLYGERDGATRGLMPGCLQEVINGELPLDLAAMLLLIPQQDLDFDWLNDMEIEAIADMGLGPKPWVDRLVKADQLIRLQRPTWRLDSRRLSIEFWHSLALPSLAPVNDPQPEPSLF